MKILFFIESLRAGGKERRIIELLKGLRKQPFIQIELVLTRDEIHYQEVHGLNIPIHIIERKIFKKDPLLFFKFYRIARKFMPDVIHVWGHMVAVYAVPAKWLLKVPLLNNEITDSTPNQKLLGKQIVFRASDRIIANTHAGLEAYQAPKSKSGVIYNGFNFDRLSTIEEKEHVKKKFRITTRNTIGMVASFTGYKDYGTFVQAANSVLKQFSDVTFLCIGDGDSAEFQKMAADHADRILFLGKQDQVESIMNVCDIGVLLTNTKNHGEGISNALMEFMALGKPVITTNFGGSIELVEDGRSGYLVKAFNHQEVADKIIHLLTNSSVLNDLGRNAAQRISEEFSIEKMVGYFLEEYKTLSRL